MPKQPWYRILYIQVIIAIILGVTLGYYYPDAGKALKPLGDGFISLIKMMIAPAIFCTVVHGIASIGDMRKVGRIGGKTLLYFETVSTVALLIGLLVGHYLQPGAGFNIDPATLDPKSVASYVTRAKDESFVSHLLAIIPNSYFDSLAKGDLLQVLLVAILSGFAISHMGKPGEAIANGIDLAGKMFFRIIGMIVQLAPIGAFGAMAFTIGKYGVGSLQQLAYLMGTFYVTCALFVFVLLNIIAGLAGFSLWKFLRYIKEELLIVLGTSSSESVLPRMMEKLENLGARKSVVGLVIPTGYSFNLDGTSIYLTMAAVFIAQATNTNLSFAQEVALLGILLLTSKGAAGVTGSGFVVLAGTLAALGTVPVAGLALILGIDRFMSEGRAITNIIGNGVATLVVARSEKELDMDRLTRVLNGEQLPPVNADVQAEERGEGRKLGSAQPA